MTYFLLETSQSIHFCSDKITNNNPELRFVLSSIIQMKIVDLKTKKRTVDLWLVIRSFSSARAQIKSDEKEKENVSAFLFIRLV